MKTIPIRPLRFFQPKVNTHFPAQMKNALEKQEADVQGLKEQLQAKDAELDKLRQQLQAQKTGAEELQKRFEATKLELIERDGVIRLEKERKASLEAEMLEIRQGLEDAAAQASAAEEREAQLQKRIGVLESEREELSARLQLEADARVNELAAKLATAEAELANKLSDSEAEWAQRLSEADAAAAEKLAAAQKELTAVRADLQRAKQELVEQKERWEREKCEQAERQVAELQQGVRERARAVEQLEKDLEESGGAIQQLKEGITRRDVRIKDLERELSEVRECFANESQAREKELEAERARGVEAREQLQEEIAKKDAEVGELRKEIQEIHNTVARHREEDFTLSAASKETVARAGVADDIKRRKEELKVVREVVQANKASPSKMRASWGPGSRGRLSDPGQPADREGENGALEGDASEEAVVVPKPAGLKGRMSLIGRKAERKWDEDGESPTQESFGVDDERERELQERLREKEGALAAEVVSFFLFSASASLLSFVW
jgi:chromosome segregation ATPase